MPKKDDRGDDYKLSAHITQSESRCFIHASNDSGVSCYLEAFNNLALTICILLYFMHQFLNTKICQIIDSFASVYNFIDSVM